MAPTCDKCGGRGSVSTDYQDGRSERMVGCGACGGLGTARRQVIDLKVALLDAQRETNVLLGKIVDLLERGR